jgi:hypothetical protein
MKSEDYLFEEIRLGLSIKVNITCLMIDVLIPNYLEELNTVTGYYDDEGIFHEAMEYWIVSEYLYRQLKQRKEPVVKFKNLFIWGRCGTGYPLTQEQVLIDIFNS